ncbi:MAG: DUF2807 domain-containing protein [Anaerolineales bacterium]|nr:DUF2807 domain-containing protein [Anaerolineales bacterium]
MSNRPRSIFGPLLLIAAGVIWLLVKSGNIPTSNLWALTHIWPYVLIAAGVGLILRSYWRYASVLMDVVIIGGALYAVMSAPQLGWDNPSMVTMFDDSSFYVGVGKPGSGNVITETREASGYTSIKVNYPARVIVMQGPKESIKIEAEDNLLPNLQTRVRGDTLDIFYKVNDDGYVNPTKPVKITVVVKELKDVHFDSAGALILDGIKTDSLDVSVSGAGNLEVNDLDAKKFSVDLSGAGSMSATGEADDFDLNISGFGSFNGKDLHNKTARVNLSGAGSATVWVDDTLDATISGAGSVNYYGSPEVTKQVSGLGGVSKSGDK